MATLNFPENPDIGDTATAGSTTYVWNGYAWLVQPGAATLTDITATTVTITSTATIEYPYPGYLTGALKVEGSASIGGDLYLGGTLYSDGQLVLTTSSFVESVNGGVDITITNSTGTLIWNNVSTLETVTSRGSSSSYVITLTNQTESTSTNTGALIVEGGIGVAKRVTCESLQIADAIFDSTTTLVNTTDITAIDTYNLSDFRSAKYLIQIDEGIGSGADFDFREIMLVADNDDNVWAVEYGAAQSGNLGTFLAESTGSVVTLYFTAVAPTNKTVKVLRTSMRI